MIDSLKDINDRREKLKKMSVEDLQKIYQQVFTTSNGELVMQDLADRCYIFEPTNGSDIKEGMRAAWLTIHTRLLGAVAPEIKKED